jgi:hypothetical protein
MNPPRVCAERATKVEDTAAQTHDAFLRKGLQRLADAWRRLGAAYKLAEDIERKSANSTRHAD